MRTTLALLLFALSTPIGAFEPSGPPPAKTISWTTSFATRIIIPRIRYKGETPERAIQHLMGVTGIPREYSIVVDTTQLKASHSGTVTFDADNVTLLQALSRIAEQLSADLLITPGVIVFVRR